MYPRGLRRKIIEQSKRAKAGHIGSSLSIVEILIALYRDILNIPEPTHPNRDRFILSKGHAALALYTTLHAKNWISDEMLNSYCEDASHLGVHSEHFLRGIDFSTGSLGQGLSYGVGAALAASLQASNRMIYVLMSDAECNEGSVWEAVMFAAHHHLSNLVVIIDDNKQQALGYTKDVLSLNPLSEKWRVFGWEAIEVDGHNIDLISEIIKNIDKKSGKPHVIIAQTVFGKGISFMESKIEWHYLSLSDAQYDQAILEVNE